jgi:uncharacterized protein YigA (DUF484 family)
MMNNRGNITDGSSVGLPSTSTVNSTISPSAVRDFLKDNPAFLTENPELLETAAGIDGQKTNVVDFAAAQANVFRRRYESLKSNHLSLIRAGRENQGHLDELRSVLMQLIRVSSIPAVVSTILETYGRKFQVPFVVLGIEANRNETGEFHVDQFRRLTPGSVERLMGDYDKVLSPSAGQEAIIFVDNADEVQSCALYRLSIGMQRRPGVLAFGTTETGIFSPDQADDLISILCSAAGAALSREFDRL